MRRFSVLHLSDLHIREHQNTYPPILKKLIDDVYKECKKIDNIILIVTGDIIDKSEYEKASSIAVSFFVDLSKKLNGKIKHIFFTPGNHDKKRVSCNSVLQDYFKGKEYKNLDEKFLKSDWKNLYSHAFDDYKNLINLISASTGIHINSDLFYCNVIELNNCLIRINSLNSAISSFSDYDYGLLHIGKFQIQKVEQDFEQEKEKFSERDVDVSITIMHHPTYWLCKEEYDNIVCKISSSDSLATDVLLRGHTHDRSLENHYTLYNSFSTLVTGIGENTNSENNANTVNEHPQRYSIYTFMCDLNLIEITMKSSFQQGFIPDYSAYINDADENRKKIHFPLHVHNLLSNSFLRIPLVNKDFQPIFPSKQILDAINANTESLLYIKEQLMFLLFTYKSQLIDELKDFLSEESTDIFNNQLMNQGLTLSQKEQDLVNQLLNEHQEKIIQTISGLLYEACYIIAKEFFENKLKDDEKIRVHFRVYNCQTNSHEGFTNYTIVGRKPQANGYITPVKWGDGLIKKSFDIDEPLFYSLNRLSIDDKRMGCTEWTDYFTYSPSIHCNSFTRPKERTNKPAITFGINSNCSDCHLFFETLSLIPMKKLIEDFLVDINTSFKFSFESLIRK